MATFEIQDLNNEDQFYSYLLHNIRAFRHVHSPLRVSYNWVAHGEEHQLRFVEFLDNEFSEKKFFKYVENNIDQLIDKLNARWLLAILFCYVDAHKKKDIQLQALVISNMIRMEQFHLASLLPIEEHLENYYPKKLKIDNKTELVDGLTAYSGETDTLQLLVYRTLQLVTYKPFVKIWRYFVKKLESTELALHHGLNDYTSYDVLLEELEEKAQYGEKLKNSIYIKLKKGYGTVGSSQR